MTTTQQAVETAVAKRDTTPAGMVRQYGSDFKQVMPTHIKGDAWIRVAVGALKRGRKQGGRYELEIAAENNPGVFLAALLDAARLGLEPGTEQYYLTARKVKGNLEILGIVGYQGIIELMYRAGAVSSVVAEVVRQADVFVWTPGSLDTEMIRQGLPPRWEGPQTRPYHEIDWDAEDRGALRLVYAYALMKDGATSRVVVLNRSDIARIKESSQGSNSEYSPWVKHEQAMWLKSSVRQLAKWVPTSAEYIIHTDRLAAAHTDAPPPANQVEQLPGGASVNRSTGEILDNEVDHHHEDETVVDAVIVDEPDEPTWPTPAGVPS